MVVLYWKSASLKILTALTILFFGLTISISLTYWGSARFKQTSVFYFNNAVQNRIDAYAPAAGEGHNLDLKIFANKPLVYSREIIRQYFSYWSPSFLFLDGGRPFRYLVPDQGLFPIALLALTLFVGGLVLANREELQAQNWNPTLLLLILWLVLITPLSAAVTLDEIPNVHRSAVFGSALVLLFSFLYYRFSSLKKYWKLLIVAFWLVFAGETLYFFHHYIVLSPSAQAFTRYDDRTKLAKRLIEIRSDYETIIVPREIFVIYYLFYTDNYSPELAGQFQKNLILPFVDNLRFIDSDCPSSIDIQPSTQKTLIVDMAHCDANLQYKPEKSTVLQNATYKAYSIAVPDEK